MSHRWSYTSCVGAAQTVCQGSIMVYFVYILIVFDNILHTPHGIFFVFTGLGTSVSALQCWQRFGQLHKFSVKPM